MKFSSQVSNDAISERTFFVDDIPGVLWTPPNPEETTPLVLIAHGGGQHKQADPVRGRASKLTSTYGFNVVAIDATGHGDRPKAERDEFVARWSDIRERMQSGEDVAPLVQTNNTLVAERTVDDWRTTLDALERAGTYTAETPVAFVGMSLGGSIGVRLLSEDTRITCAVLGLVGGPELLPHAARITAPVELHLQWDDELISREHGLALYDALASREKSLHVNPGRHAEVPTFERESAERFLVRHLKQL